MPEQPYDSGTMSAGNQYVIRIGNFVREGGAAGGPLTRLLALVATLLMAVLFLLLLIPLAVIGAIGAVCFFAYRKVAGFINAARSPNGVLDGRRNVRVIDRSDR